MKMFYILQGKIPILAKSMLEHCEWMQTNDRHVAKTDMPGEVWISTVFLGIDHDFRSGLEPVLFETMVFGGEFNRYQRRYTSWADAEAGHQQTIDKVAHVTVN